MSQLDLANKVGVREKDISRWENNHNEPRFAVIAKLAAALHVTTDYLTGATDVAGGPVDRAPTQGEEPQGRAGASRRRGDRRSGKR